MTKIPQEEIDAVVNNQKSAEEVAENYQVTKTAVTQRVRKGKLAMSFTTDTGDLNPAPVENKGILQKIDTMTSEEIKEIFRGLWTFVDQILRMIINFTPNYEYEPLTDKDMDVLLIGSSSQSHLAQYLKGSEILGLTIFAGLIISVFGLRIKKKGKLSDKVSQQPIKEPEVLRNIDTKDLEKEINKELDKIENEQN